MAKLTVKVQVLKDGVPLGQKEFLANTAATPGPGWFENAVNWMVAIVQPVADDLHLKAMEQLVAQRRQALDEAKR